MTLIELWRFYDAYRVYKRHKNDSCLTLDLILRQSPCRGLGVESLQQGMTHTLVMNCSSPGDELL